MFTKVRMSRCFHLVIGFILGATACSGAVDFNEKILPIFREHCLDCHSVNDAEGKLVMEDFSTLMKGGESGSALIPGKSSDSLLVRFVEGTLEKEGKKKIMPPGKRKKLTSEEIALIRQWIDAGALPPEKNSPTSKELKVPQIKPSVSPRRAIQSMDASDVSQILAIARYGEVELRSLETGKVIKTLTGHKGSVNAVSISNDGKLLASAAGQPALSGELKLWSIPDGKLLRTIEAHTDALYAVAISPSGKQAATGSYDQKIKTWDVESGRELLTLSAHNGAVFDLAYRPDGKVLASASADRTVKLWDVETGKRLDTLSQSLKELYAVSFSPDGERLIAAGVDNRIRMWHISPTAIEGSNEILFSRFAHESPVLNVTFSRDGARIISSAEDRTVKVWDALQLVELLLLPVQPDQVPAITFFARDKSIALGRSDGSVETFDVLTGKKP